MKSTANSIQKGAIRFQDWRENVEETFAGENPRVVNGLLRVKGKGGDSANLYCLLLYIILKSCWLRKGGTINGTTACAVLQNH